MVKGYLLIGSDNGSNLLDNQKHPMCTKCPECGYLLEFDYYNPFFKLKKKSYDYSECYDLGIIVSLRFKEFCVRGNYPHLRFQEFDREPNFFLFTALETVKFDTIKAKTEFKKKCNACGKYEEVFGIAPSALSEEIDVLPDGFYSTDTLFGFGNTRHPLIIASPITLNKLKKEKMKGLYFEQVY